MNELERRAALMEDEDMAANPLLKMRELKKDFSNLKDDYRKLERRVKKLEKFIRRMSDDGK